MSGDIKINNEFISTEEKPSECDSSDPGDDFDNDIRLRQDVRGKLSIGRTPKVKKVGKSMAKVDQLKMRGIVSGKRGQINTKRTFKTRISLKEMDFGGSANFKHTGDEELDELDDENFKSSTSYDEKIDSHMKRSAYVKNFTEDMTPTNSLGDAAFSGWLN